MRRISRRRCQADELLDSLETSSPSTTARSAMPTAATSFWNRLG